MYITSRSNLIKACMQIYDTFMDDFYDEKYLETLSDLDIRAQLEVHCNLDNFDSFSNVTHTYTVF